MTQTGTTVSRGYLCDGAVVDFAIPFVCSEEDEVTVYLRDESVSPAVETQLTNPGEFTVDDELTTVTTVTAYDSDFRIFIRRSTPLTQEDDYVDNDGVPAERFEAGLDKLTRALQELAEIQNRSILVPITSGLEDLELPTPEANASFRWDDTGEALENFVIEASSAELSYLVGVTSSIQDQLDNLSAAGAAYVIYGSTGSPGSIVAGSGITPSADQRQLRFIQGSGGAVDISANPQIAAGTIIGQEMKLVGCSDANTVLLEHGTGLVLNGSCTLRNGSTIDLFWNGAAWVEDGRNSI